MTKHHAFSEAQKTIVTMHTNPPLATILAGLLIDELYTDDAQPQSL